MCSAAVCKRGLFICNFNLQVAKLLTLSVPLLGIFLNKCSNTSSSQRGFSLQCRSHTTITQSGAKHKPGYNSWESRICSLPGGLAACADYIAGRKTVLLTADQVSVVNSSRNRLKTAMHQQYICLHLIFKTNIPMGASYLTLAQHERWAWKWQLLCTLYQAQDGEYSCHIWLMSKINVFTAICFFF